MSNPPAHVLSAILAASRVSKRAARAVCNAYGFGGGSCDLARVLAMIESDPRRAEIEALSVAANPMTPPPEPPHERFILGMGESGRQYVTHTQEPRFVCELFEEDEAIAAGGVNLDLGGERAANFAWIDPPPGEAELREIMGAMRAAIEEADARGEIEIEAEERREEEE